VPAAGLLQGLGSGDPWFHAACTVGVLRGRESREKESVLVVAAWIRGKRRVPASWIRG
jgi:hypothetical protein